MNNQQKPTKKHSFDDKWSSAIGSHGHTAIPNLLLKCRKTLGITNPELNIIIAILVYRWDDTGETFPSIETLAQIVGISKRQARLIVTSLHNKGLVKRTERTGQSNTFDFEQLIYKLDQLAISSLPRGRKQPPSWEETRLEARKNTTPYKDIANQNKEIKPIINTGVEKIGDIARRYQR